MKYCKKIQLNNPLTLNIKDTLSMLSHSVRFTKTNLTLYNEFVFCDVSNIAF